MPNVIILWKTSLARSTQQKKWNMISWLLLQIRRQIWFIFIMFWNTFK